ncbi:MAG: hypothetical protein ACR2GH_08520 [Pseudonocardia sp.]
MAELLLALVTAGVGVALLVLLLVGVRRPVRRFTLALAGLRADVAERVVRLQTLVNFRRGGRE